MTALGTIALYAARSASVRMLLILFLRQQALQQSLQRLHIFLWQEL